MHIRLSINAVKRAAGLIAICALATGCATGRSTVDLRPASSANPSAGPAVKLVRVTDRRIFQVSPSSPSTPSLMDGKIHDKALTSRAIARKRGGFGAALGDILLPDGRTVAQVTEATVSRGLRRSGYRVLEPGDAGHEEAVPLEVDVFQFWAWFTPGFSVITLEFDSRIRVSGPVEPFEGGEEFRGYAKLESWAAFEEDWLAVMHKGLDNLNAAMISRNLLRSGSFAPPPASHLLSFR